MGVTCLHIAALAQIVVAAHRTVVPSAHDGIRAALIAHEVFVEGEWERHGGGEVSAYAEVVLVDAGRAHLTVDYLLDQPHHRV